MFLFCSRPPESIPPELREGEGEVALARTRRLPELIKQNDLHDLPHCHTDFSDGGNTLEETAEATRKRGYHYFGVADNSHSAGYAAGLRSARLQVTNPSCPVSSSLGRNALMGRLADGDMPDC